MDRSDLVELREELKARHESVKREFLRTKSARDALQQQTRLIDNTLESIWSKHLSNNDISVFSLGGYGRGELYPASDIDILIAYPADRADESRRRITRSLHLLWDLGLTVGQQVWSWDELLDLGLEEREFLFALLDCRKIAGLESEQEASFLKFLKRFFSDHQASLRDQLVQWAIQRHRSFRNTIYQLEPDLKQSPGGVRDCQMIHWALLLNTGPSFSHYSELEISQAHDFLSQLRILLHYITGRDHNLLTHRLQEKVTEHLGYRKGSTRSAVESLMKEYFLHARVIYGTCRKLLGAQETGTINQITARELAPGASVEDILRLFEKSLDEQRPLSEKLSAKVAAARSHALEALSYPKLERQVRTLFKVRPGLYKTLNNMYEVGVLEILFPEFGTTKAQVIRDFYHKYTVDEHSLQAIKAIEELVVPGSEVDPRFQSLLSETPRSEILSLTLLLHDVGKGRGGKHVDTGARLAAKALRRYRFDNHLINTVVFLIANHLAMSSIIFRRNLQDPEVIRRFSELFSDVDPLRLLTLVTYADIKGVAPGSLNAWKKERLWQLYVATYNKLTLGFGEERIEEEDIGHRLTASLPKDLDSSGFERFLEGFPLRYLTTTPPSEIYAHYRLGRKFLPSRSAQVKLTRKSSFYELCVVTADTLHLFSRIAGVISYFGMNILRGYGFSNRQKIILDFFQFEDPQGIFMLNPGEKQRFRKVLLDVVSDDISVEELLQGKEESLMFKSDAPGFRPLISFGEGQQTDYSIMEIVAPDSIGLLYRISREISESGCNIELVLISTEGDRAVDVFYLSHNGARLESEIREELMNRIIQAIG